jgi:C1A family cysteine protease
VPYKIARYGWVPDLPDQRDHLFAAAPEILSALPASVDLRPDCPEVYDQGQLGSCTANALAGAFEFDQMKQKLAAFTPSRLYVYYNERVIEGTAASDSGAQIRDGIKTVAKQGACHETLWPYDVSKFADQPPPDCYADGGNNRSIRYQRLVALAPQLKGCLAGGSPFIFGFTVYESFESPEVAKSGHAPMPASSEQVLGGHAVMAVGYDDSNNWWLVRNSWGPNWGMAGYFTMPYAYLTSPGLASDFWTIQSVA